MRSVWTWYPRDSNTVCARLSIFNASATCCWYCVRSRLMNAVIARIFGFSCAGAVFCCARAIPQLLASVMSSAAIARAQQKTDRKSTRLNSSHGYISYAVFCLKKRKNSCYDLNFGLSDSGVDICHCRVFLRLVVIYMRLCPTTHVCYVLHLDVVHPGLVARHLT